jgi:glucosamine--fructose-6-phosphate aminotransferase (isomerizing)
VAFLEEVAEQPAALRRLVEFYGRREGRALLASARTVAGVSPRTFLFTGMGTSEHAPHSVSDRLAEAAGVPVVIRDAGELLHYGLRTVSFHDAVFAVSQSGESIETRRVAEALKGHPRLIAITNEPGSTIARLARVNLPLLAGSEASISTKTYTNTLGVLALLPEALTGRETTATLGALEGVAGQMEEWAEHRAPEARAAADTLGGAGSITFVARGPSLAAARQAALTFQEGAHAHTCALSGGAFRHGPMEMIGPESAAVFFADASPAGDLLRTMAAETASLGARVVLLSARPAEERSGMTVLQVPCPDPMLFPLACSIAQELMLDQMARARGLVTGEFRRSGKVTTAE